MMYIGTSFGGCLRSILLDEVSIDDVLVIITKTKAETLKKLYEVTEKYYYFGNPYSAHAEKYQFNDIPLSLEKIQIVVENLWVRGKIHQPRLYGYGDTNLLQILNNTDALWIEVSPIGLNTNPIVIEAYEKYRMWDKLTR